MTSWPASAARAAATAESTPPDMAARTFIGVSRCLARRARARSTTGPIASTSASTSAWVEVWPSENRSERAGLLVVAAHREQHVRGLGYAGRAGRPGRALDAAGVEQHQQRVALAAGEARGGRCRAAGAGRSASPLQLGVGHRRRRPGAPGRRAAPRRRAACSAWCLTASSTAAAKPAIAGVSMVPRADVALLAAAVHAAAVTLDLAAYDERADAVRAADLVAGQGQRVDAGRGEVDRHRADRLDGVGVHRDAVRGRDRDDLVDRLERCRPRCWPTSPRPARPTPGSRSIASRERVDVEPARRVDRQQLDLGALVLAEPVQRVEHGVVLDRRGQDPARGAGRRRGATSRGP